MNITSKKYTFKKHERLCKKVEINQLFSEGKGFTIYPLKFVYQITDDTTDNNPIKLLISVPKKLHRKAVKRNLLKRRIREAYRIYKPTVYSEEIFNDTSINLGIIYISNEILTQQDIEKKLILGLRKLITEITKRNSFY